MFVRHGHRHNTDSRTPPRAVQLLRRCFAGGKTDPWVRFVRGGDDWSNRPGDVYQPGRALGPRHRGRRDHQLGGHG
jgi:hypothetical protein